MVVNDNAYELNKRGALEAIASKLAPTVSRDCMKNLIFPFRDLQPCRHLLLLLTMLMALVARRTSPAKRNRGIVEHQVVELARLIQGETLRLERQSTR